MKSKKGLFLLYLILALLLAPVINQVFDYGTAVAEAATVSLNKSKLSLVVGNSYTLKVKGSSKKVKWMVANSNIASVSSKGKVTALKAGKTDIYAYVGNKIYICKLTVTDAVLNYKSVTLDLGETLLLKLEGTKGKVEWYSNHSSVASVDSKGKVTAHDIGTATITAKVGNSKYNCQVDVKGVYRISAYLENDCLYPGENSQITIKTYPSSEKVKTISYKSSDESIARVDENGVITGVNPGFADITVTVNNGISDALTVLILARPVLTVRNATFVLGEGREEIVARLGQPSRIAKSNYGDETYIYADDYNRLLLLYMKDNRLVGWYTNSVDFEFFGYSKESKTEQKSDWNYRYKYTVYIDTLGKKNVDAVFVIDSQVELNPCTDEVIDNMEKEIFDITNSYRVQNGLQAFLWSDKAAASARKHSQDMATNNYFDHYSLSGASPFERMKREGIYYTIGAENIAAYYRTSFDACHGWFMSEGHRSNILDPGLDYLGVGIGIDKYGYPYYTQNFYG